MIARNLRAPGNGAGGQANEGHRESAELTPAASYPHVRLGYRAHRAPGGEQQLLAHLHATLGAQIPHSLITSYYVSLKANPFVVLTGREGGGKAAFAISFANALLGAESDQCVVISSGSWAQHSGEHSYYSGLHERFGSLHFIETLQEAAAPEHAGRVYLLLLRGLSIEELHHYFNELLQVSPTGEKRLALPGILPERQPILPPNIFITATLNLPRLTTPLDQEALRHAGQIAFGPELPTLDPAPAAGAIAPVGLQRTMLAATLHNPLVARARLVAILGRRELRRLRPSELLAATLWRSGAPPARQSPDELLTFVANSFDATGRGLFDPEDARHNTQVACDAFVAQRALGRIAGCQVALRRQITALVDA